MRLGLPDVACATHPMRTHGLGGGAFDARSPGIFGGEVGRALMRSSLSMCVVLRLRAHGELPLGRHRARATLVPVAATAVVTATIGS